MQSPSLSLSPPSVCTFSCLPFSQQRRCSPEELIWGAEAGVKWPLTSAVSTGKATVYPQELLYVFIDPETYLGWESCFESPSWCISSLCTPLSASQIISGWIYQLFAVSSLGPWESVNFWLSLTFQFNFTYVWVFGLHLCLCTTRMYWVLTGA